MLNSHITVIPVSFGLIWDLGNGSVESDFSPMFGQVEILCLITLFNHAKLS